MSRRTSPKQPAVAALTARQIARMDREADAFLLIADADALQKRVADAAARDIVTTPEKLLKNDRRRQDHSRGVAIAPRDNRAGTRRFDETHADALISIKESELAPAFRTDTAKKTWGDADWASQCGFGSDPADFCEEVEEYILAGGDEAAAAEAARRQEEEERLKREAIHLLHPRDQPRVRAFLAGVPVAQIAEEEGVTLQCIYEALARSELRIGELLEYRRQCKIWAMSGGQGDRPELPEIDDGATAEQIELFADADADAEVQP